MHEGTEEGVVEGGGEAVYMWEVHNVDDNYVCEYSAISEGCWRELRALEVRYYSEWKDAVSDHCFPSKLDTPHLNTLGNHPFIKKLPRLNSASTTISEPPLKPNGHMLIFIDFISSKYQTRA